MKKIYHIYTYIIWYSFVISIVKWQGRPFADSAVLCPFSISPLHVGGGKEFVVHVYPQNPLLWSIIRLPIWKFWNFREKKTPNRPNYFLDFPIIGPKKKVVVNFIYGYQTLSGEKCKSSGKRISSIRHTSEEKNPKNHPKMPYFRKVVFSMVFWIFLFTGMSDWPNSFSIALVFFSC